MNRNKIIVVLIAGVPLVILLHASVLSALWGWFIVPLGVAPIGIAHAFGLAVLAKYLRSQFALNSTPVELQSVAKATQRLYESVAGALAALLVGWIAAGVMS